MEQIPTTSSGGNATAAPSSAGPSFTPPTPVQPSDNNCIDKRLQSVSESEYQDDEYDEPDHQMYLSGSSGSEGELSEVGRFGINQEKICRDPNNHLNSTFLIAADDTDTEQSIEGDPDTHRQLEALLQAAGSMLRPSLTKLGVPIESTTDPEVLRKLTNSVSCALDEAAAALTRMRAETKNDNKTLVEACHDGDVGAVRKLLTEGRSVHETSEEGESLLSLACSAGYYELAQVLLAMQANVEDRGIKGDCTPLMEAASSGFVEIVRLLLAHGAVVNALSSTGNTPLMYACAGGHVDTVKELLNYGANVEDHNENGHTPLMEAASAGHVPVAKILLEHGAGINTHSNEFKESALTLACYKGHLEMVRFLLAAGADQEHKTDEMHTALMEASMDGHVEVARLLLDSGAQVNMPTDSFESPLTLAACGGHVELALLLIDRGANIEEVNDEGYTPLMEAAREGHEDMVSVLLSKGANINAQTEETQETALTLACCGGFLDVADFLIKNGAILELGASTPLMEAAQEGHIDLVRYLLECGADVHAQTTSADTALTYACENGHTDVADLLLQFGANLEHESEGGRTPLMKACRAGHLCTVQFLISKAADINKVTANNDHTPLSLACAGGHLSVVELLLAHSADPFHKLKDNSTMVIEAAKGGHTNVVKLLLDYPHSVMLTPPVSPVPTTPAEDVPVVDESALSEVQVMSKAHAIAGRIVESYGPNAKHNANSCIQKAMIRKAQLNTPNSSFSDVQFKIQLPKENNVKANAPTSKPLINTAAIEQQLYKRQQIAEDLKRVEQELKENGSLSMVTLMTTPPPLSASSPGVLDSSTSSNGSNSESSASNTSIGSNKAGDASKNNPSQPVSASSDVVQTTAISDRPKIKAKFKKKPAQPLAGMTGVNEATQATLDANYARGVMAGVAAMKPQFKAEFIERHSGDGCDKELAARMIKFCEEQTAKREANDGGHANLKELMISSLMSEHLLKVRKDLQIPDNMVKNLLPLSGALHDSLPHGTTGLLPLPGDLNTRIDFKALNCIDAELLENLVRDSPLTLEDISNLPNIDERLQKEIQNHRCNINSSDSGLSSTFSSQSFKNYVQNQTSIDFRIKNLSSMDIANFAGAVSQLSLDESASQQQPTTTTIPTLINCVPTQVAAATQTPSESVTSNKRSATTTSTTTATTTTTNKGKKARYQVRPQPPSSAPQPGSNNTPASNSVAQSDVASSKFSTTTGESYGSDADISYGINVDSQTESNHDTALTVACAGGHEELVKLLLVRGANIEHRDKKGFTPLILAATGGFDKIVEILLSNVANMEAQSERTKDTPLSLACSGGRYEVCDLLLQRGANKEHRNVSDYTPLSLAASGGYVNIIKLLLSNGAEINSRTGSKLGISPLMLAAMNGHTAAVKLLLDMGSDINAQIETNRNTALTLACFQGRHEVVSLLLDRKANVEHRAKTGLTPLMEAASGGYVEVGRVLIDKGADVNANPVPSSRDTALTIAADKGHVRFVELLLEKNAHVEVKNKKGNSPLWLAANGGHLGVIELLYKVGANIDSQDNRKVTCLMAAFRKGHVKVVRWMVNHVSQFPSDQEMTRFLTTLSDKESIDKCHDCMIAIRISKDQQAARANKNASILLEELDMEKTKEELKKASAARRKMKKKKKKQAKSGKKLEEETEEKNDEQEIDEEEEEEDEEEEVPVTVLVEMKKKVDLKKKGKVTVLSSVMSGDVEEGDSGIDANSQGSCSSTDAKNAAARLAQTQIASSNKKEKKKKSKEVCVEVKPTTSTTNSKLTTNSAATQTNTAKVNSSQTKSNKEKKNQVSSTQSKIATTAVPPTKTEIIPQAVTKNAQLKTKVQQSNNNVTNTTRKESVKLNNYKGNNKVVNNMVFESTQNPAAREDFEATGSENFLVKHKKHPSEEYIHVGAKTSNVSPVKQTRGREEGWKEVVRTRYLASPYRSKKVSVPLNAISRVIGRGGSNINAIRASTGALIEVDNQSKGQGERIITIKGSTDVTKQAHDLIAMLIKDPEVNIMSVIAKNPKVTSAWDKSVNNAKAKTAAAAALPLKLVVSQPISVVTTSKLTSAPSIVASMTIKPTITVNGPRPTVAAVAAGEKKITTSTVKPTMSYTNAIISSSDSVSKPSQQPQPPVPSKVVQSVSVTPSTTATVTVSVTPITTENVSTPAMTVVTKSTNALPLAQPKPQQESTSVTHHPVAIVSPMVSKAPLPPQPQIKPQVVDASEYSLFDSFSKISVQTMWGRDGECGGQKPSVTFTGGNHIPAVTPSIGTIGQPKKYLETETPMADASKAPGYRGAGLSSPISTKTGGGNTGSTNGSRTTTPPMSSPVTQYNNNTGIQPAVQQPQPEPYHSQSQHPYISDQTHQSAQINVERSRLNPRAPDFATIKSNQNMVQPQQVYNNQVPQNFLQPPMVPNVMPFQQKFHQQLPNLRVAPNNPNRWTHFINQPPPPFGRPALHPVNGNAEMFAGMEATASPPNMSPNLDERKAPPKPIGTERAWKQNLIGENPHPQQHANWSDMKMHWAHHDLFRTPPPPPVNFPLGPRPMMDEHNLFDTYQSTEHLTSANMNHHTAMMQTMPLFAANGHLEQQSHHLLASNHHGPGQMAFDPKLEWDQSRSQQQQAQQQSQQQAPMNTPFPFIF
ncbi:PREDICTED: ankyrin repeat domain-containing protein 17-like isoform X3 [Diuraphis noxia]|uniref:ankyrin repeat domain-containing protein 17-like isoform X3 n=1 Tax=Diuraphis noxia TaxID=143948 RepID=UPI000763B986|nr:PREDICTED: ankyrin repeat domain-containing protein 17-like isoform X3 [Diuraphis noxia]